jgi:hypothetical protein
MSISILTPTRNTTGNPAVSNVDAVDLSTRLSHSASDGLVASTNKLEHSVKANNPALVSCVEKHKAEFYRDYLSAGTSQAREQAIASHINKMTDVLGSVAGSENAKSLSSSISNHAEASSLGAASANLHNLLDPVASNLQKYYSSGNGNVFMYIMYVLSSLGDVLNAVLTNDGAAAESIQGPTKELSTAESAFSQLQMIKFPVNAKDKDGNPVQISSLQDLIAHINDSKNADAKDLQGKYEQYYDPILNQLKSTYPDQYKTMMSDIRNPSTGFNALMGTLQEQLKNDLGSDAAGSYADITFNYDIDVDPDGSLFSKQLASAISVIHDNLTQKTAMSNKYQVQTQTDMTNYSNVYDLLKNVLNQMSQLYQTLVR